MNTVLLITEKNQEGIQSFVRSLLEKQKEPVQGAALVAGAYYLPDRVLRSMANELVDLYEKVEIVKIQAGITSPQEAQVAVMMATFMIRRYAAYPGSWLIIDDATEIRMDNPVTRIEKLHLSSGMQNSGRAVTDRGGRIPVGPVVLGSMIKELKCLRSVSGESWRSRARWAFQITSWNQIEVEQYPFTVKKGEDADSTKRPEPELRKEEEIKDITCEVPEARKEEAEPLQAIPSLEMSKGGEIVLPRKKDEEVTTRMKEEAQKIVSNPTVQSAPPKPHVLVSPEDYEKMTDSQLKEEFKRKTGSYPKGRIKRETVITKLREEEPVAK